MDQRVRTVIALTKAHLDRKLSIREMAGAVHLSPSHLRQLFKDETSMSLARYLREVRMQKAKELLETTFLSVKEIAAKVGISDVSHFVRDFKKAYGITPLQCTLRHRRTARGGKSASQH